MTPIIIREPVLSDKEHFIKAMQSSLSLHTPWVIALQTAQAFDDYYAVLRKNNNKSFLACDDAGNIVGIFNIREIVRGCFQSAYLGFYGVAEYTGKGYMSAGLKLVLSQVFNEMQLHRIEANIQPGNDRSIQLIQNNGFRKEGYSPRYLNISGEWRDHERWAITLEDYQSGNLK